MSDALPPMGHGLAPLVTPSSDAAVPPNPGASIDRLRMRDRPRQIQLPPPVRGAPRVQGIATAPILSTRRGQSPRTRLVDLGQLLDEEDTPSPAPARASPPTRSPDGGDYFSLGKVSPTVSTGLELGLGHPSGQGQGDLKFFRPTAVDPMQLATLAERAASRSGVLPSTLFSPPASSQRTPTSSTSRPRPRSEDMSHLFSLPPRGPRLGPAIPPMRGEFGYTSAASTPSADPNRRPSYGSRLPQEPPRSPNSGAWSSVESLRATAARDQKWAEGPKPVLDALLGGEALPQSKVRPGMENWADGMPDPAREKIFSVLPSLVRGGSLPACGPVRVVEYGSLHGSSFPLLSLLIGTLSDAVSVPASTRDEGTDMIVLHSDCEGTDFRALMTALETDSTSYLSAEFAAAFPSAHVFPYFTTRPFGLCICPRHSVDLGISLMDLHWAHPPLSNAPEPTAFSPTSPTTSPVSLAPPPLLLDHYEAERELSRFLIARAAEFRPGGQLIVAYIARDEVSRSTVQGSPASRRSERGEEVWTVLNSLLTPSIQRLVSCGMLKADVARSMMNLPLYPRTREQSLHVVREQAELWEIEWACGLGELPAPPQGSAWPTSEPRPLRIPYPAWASYAAGEISREEYAEHLVALIKNLYEAHWRVLLSHRGRLSKGAVAYTLDALYDVLQSRIDDIGPEDQLARIEFDVCIYSLRRRQHHQSDRIFTPYH